ncbi:uncharacterized protein LOC107607459 [Arachis ipaensis]|uniref:uncharacterized protein LOC107607459 n=1 Tax=Arachis ipaensis TaxID=130454 RepID=UPI0007AFC2F5|nr:uncharacterized protein LOC107607459 [Arachis ipaensis]
MTNLANTMEANAATTMQAVKRMDQLAGNGNGNENGNGEGDGNNLGGTPMTLASFLKVHPSNFRGLTNPTEVDNWFQAMEHALQAQHVPNNQFVEFTTAFYKKYFPESVREARELELMQLKQGSLSMADYTSRFEENCRFSRVCQGASESYESWKCIKYQGGLRENIITTMAPLEIRVFFELVNKARVVEDFAKKVALARDTRGRNNNHGREKYFQPKG